MKEQRRARLGDSAAARERKIFEQQVAGDELPECGNHNTAPSGGRCSARRVHVCGEPARQQDERNDNEADERADQQAQQQRKSILAPAQILDEADEAGRERRNLYLRHVGRD